MSRKKTYESVKDAFGNDIKVGDKLICFDRIVNRLCHTHLRRIVSKSRIEVVGGRDDGTENIGTPYYTWMSTPYTWVVSTKRVMKQEW